MGKFSGTEKDWNLNKGFGDVLIDNIVDVDEAAKTGDVKLWFNSLRILYRNVCGYKKIDDTVITAVNKKMMECRKTLNYLDTPSLTADGKVEKRVKKLHLKLELDGVNISLISAMHKAGLIFPLHKYSPKYSGMEI